MQRGTCSLPRQTLTNTSGIVGSVTLAMALWISMPLVLLALTWLVLYQTTLYQTTVAEGSEIASEIWQLDTTIADQLVLQAFRGYTKESTA